MEKHEPKFQFVPVNLHLQRMWARNDSIRNSATSGNAFHDTVTHGAFAAMAMEANGGLIK